MRANAFASGAARSVTLCFAVAGVTVAHADVASCERPPIEPLRYEEDYGFLRDPSCRTEVWDHVKYIPLRGSTYLSLGADLRERFEYFRNPDWGRGANDAYLLQRYMAHADVRLGAHARVFVQLASSFATGVAGGPGASDEDRLDLHQAFADVELETPRLGRLAIRAGRQEIDYEDARLISVRDGSNARLSFDAIRLMQHVHAWQVDAFASAPVETDPGVFDDGWEAGLRLWGVYAAGPIAGDAFALDLFYFGLDERDAVFDQGVADQTRSSFGARASGKASALDYNVELVYQVGSFGSGAIRAWTIASDTGFTVMSAPAVRFGIQLNATSGDRDPLDPDLQTFDPLFPQSSYFTDARLIGPLNHIDVHPVIELRPREGLVLQGHYDLFWRTRLSDGVYRTSGALIASGRGNPDRHVGSEVALRAQWQANRHTLIVASYSHFFAGPFLRAAGLDRDVDFFAVWLSYRI